MSWTTWCRASVAQFRTYSRRFLSQNQALYRRPAAFLYRFAPRASSRDPFSLSRQREDGSDELDSTSEPPLGVCPGYRGRLCPASVGARAGTDRGLHWNGHRPARQRPGGCSGPRQLAGADRRGKDHDHRREWATPLSVPASGTLRARHRAARFRSYREDDIPIGAGGTIDRSPVVLTVGILESVDVKATGSRLDARNTGFGTRFGAEDLDAIPMTTVQFVRLGQDGARDFAHLTGGRQRARVRFRFGRGPESVSHRRHERHRSDQRYRASRSGHRLHSRAADPIRGRVGRVRQRPGRRRERDHEVRKQSLSL